MAEPQPLAQVAPTPTQRGQPHAPWHLLLGPVTSDCTGLGLRQVCEGTHPCPSSAPTHPDSPKVLPFNPGVPLSSSSCGPNHPGDLNPEDMLVVGAGASWRSFMEKVAMHWTQRWRTPLCTELPTACSPPQLSRTFQGGFWASQSQSPNCRQQPPGHSSLETRPEKETVT